MSYSVGTTAQAIYPDGFQETFTLVNNGPYTIYLDSDSSVSTRSYPLPPTATIVWDEDRPLWVIAAGNFSELSMTRNGSFANIRQLGTLDLLQTVNSASTTVDSDFLEVAAYETLVVVVNVSNSDGTGPQDGFTTTSYNRFEVDYYEPSALVRGVNALNLDTRIYTALNAGTIQGTIIQSPVRGPVTRVRVTPTNAGNAGVSTTVRIFGTNRKLPERVNWYNGLDMVSFRPGLPGVFVPPDQYAQGYATWDSAIILTSPTGTEYYYFNPPSPNVQISVRGNGITTAGTLTIFGVGNSQRKIGAIAVPVAAGSVVYSQSFVIPTTFPCILAATAKPVGNDLGLSFTFS